MQINLARKWRSKHFDELVGQQLVVRLLKNSLYRDVLFPVYLLSGTRGCGKTSIARIFAAALNCDALETFQKNPQVQIPCLECRSCLAMKALNHPDFIELDAASNTGVDNIRQIIDTASFVPVLGRKKVYLIDEAHMLSKAAFNAFLKILEEPPPSVVFMLATTDPHKIIDTVTSRCFQLFFDPIAQDEVVKHLAFICTEESVSYQLDALALIAQETGGSMRDALNLVERLRIAYPSITKEAVIELLASIDDESLGVLYTTVMTGTAADLLATCARLELHRYNPQVIWKKLVELIRSTLWLKYGVETESSVPAGLKELVASWSLERLLYAFELCYTYEQSFTKTAAASTMLEMLLLKMQQGPGQTVKPAPAVIKKPEVKSAPVQKESTSESVTPAVVSETKVELQSVPDGGSWGGCLKDIEKINDPLVVSIFKQGCFMKHEAQIVEVEFSQDLVFFKDWLENTKKIWQPILESHFGAGTQLVSRFDGVSTKERPLKVKLEPVKMPASLKESSRPVKAKAEQVVTITDPEKFKKASQVMSVFSGTLITSPSDETT